MSDVRYPSGVGAVSGLRAPVAVAILAGFPLPCVSDIVHANGAHEVELRPADINVGAVFGEMKGVISPHQVAPSGVRAFEIEPVITNSGKVKDCG